MAAQASQTPCRAVSTGAARTSTRAQALAVGGGKAAKVWEACNELAARPGMVNMSQGFPDFPGSKIAREVAAAAVAAGDAPRNQYSPQPGLMALREAIARFQQRRYGAVLNPASEVIVTAGAQEALAAIFAAYLNPGDEVVLFEPFYPFMLGAMTLAGAIPRMVTLRAENGFAISEDEVRAAVERSKGRAKMIVLNSPHNPTGHVASVTELEAFARVCADHDLLAIADEVYEHCVFDGGHRQLAAVDGMRERTITLGSGGKLFSLTGWRVAWACGPADLLRPIGQAHTHLSFCSPTPLQTGVAAALDAEDGLSEIAPLFRDNFKMLADALTRGTDIRSICPAQGGYFMVAQTDGISDVEFATKLADEKGIVCTPMSVFYASDLFKDTPCTLVRFTICKSREHIQRACDALLGNKRQRVE